MNKMRALRAYSSLLRPWLLAAVWLVAGVSLTCAEETFDTLQIGTQTYKNVTVTTKTTNYVFLLYDGGMGNIRVTDLPRNVQQKLGYLPPDPVNVASTDGEEVKKPKVKFDPKNPMPWIKQNLEGIRTVRAKQVTEAIQQSGISVPTKIPKMAPLESYSAIAAVFLFYIFICLCARMICVKAGSEPGLLIWIPIFQMIPMIAAARMSRLWFIAYFIPVLNIIGGIIWCFEIAKARGKSAFTGFLLLLPFFNILAFFYLAFSSAEEAPDTKKKSTSAPRKDSLVLETV